MDYDIRGRKAIVCAASRGLGKGCAIALAREGVDLVINGRNPDTLASTAQEIQRETGVSVQWIVADITTQAGRAQVLEACPDPDILVTNAGGPPPGDFRNWDRQQWIDALDANMLTPIALMRATLDGMIERGFGRIINITSSGVKEPISVLGLSNGARTGLTGFVAGLSRDVIKHNVTINNLLPGAFDTDRRAEIIQDGARKSGKSAEQVREDQIRQTPANRFGTPAEFGAVCAFLCSVHAGFMTGQNLMLDGGAYKGTMG